MEDPANREDARSAMRGALTTGDGVVQPLRVTRDVSIARGALAVIVSLPQAIPLCRRTRDNRMTSGWAVGSVAFT
ncbi:MAG: hypothetical protein KKB37_14010, partial [Alphaproteobacteria bacterium]|nr:hypothetical protein [Alphaproteobacteria bacterium]